MNLKLLQKEYFYISFVLIIYFSLIIFIGSDRIEDGNTTHFSLLFYSKHLFNPFLFYYDLIGPGSRMPLGTGLDFFFLPAFAIFNLKLFYFITFISCFFLQFYYLKKLFNFFKFNFINVLFLLYAFSIGIFYNIINSDSIKTFFLISCLPGIFYHFLKFFRKKNEKSFYKFLLFFTYLSANSHPVSLILLSLTLIIFVFFNKDFFFLRKKYFYFGVFLFLCVLSEEIYRLYYETAKFAGINRTFIIDLDLKHYTSGLVFILKFFEPYYDFPYLSEFKAFDNLYLPFAGLMFYFSFFESILLVIKKKSKNVFYINYIFFLLIFLSIIDLRNVSFNIISTSFTLRDYNNFFSLILFASFINNFKNNKVSKFIIIACLISTFLHIFISIEKHIKDNSFFAFNLLKQNKEIKESELAKLLNLKKKNNSYTKTYLSERIYKIISYRTSSVFREANIFNITDLIKYNIYPFNMEFKNASKNQLRVPTEKMYAKIEPLLEEINNNYFFNVFHITNLIILETELNKVDLQKFNIVNSLRLNDNDNVLFLELIDQRNVIFNEKKFTDHNNCLNASKINCLIKNENLFTKSKKISFERLKLNTYKIINYSEFQEDVILPFLYDTGWRINDKKIKNINKSLMYVKLEPSEEVFIYYRDYIRSFLKIISIIGFLTIIVCTLKLKIVNVYTISSKLK